jgi:hypothetical protein
MVAAASDADFLGNPLSPGEPEAHAALNDFLAPFLAYEAKAGRVLKNAAGNPNHAMLNAYAAALCMLMETPQGPARAAPFLDRARAAAGHEREGRTVDFIETWVAGDVPAALTLAEAVIDDWPRDLGMVKLAQYLTFNTGAAADMLRLALKALPAAEDIPEAHGLAAFGFEQCHLLADAERAARRAIEMKRGEAWAQHALAHVMITEGRIDEGACFLEGAADTWAPLNSFMSGHNWWHLCLFYLSQGRAEAVLGAYDDHLWAGDKDYSQDQVGAVSLLARAELAGIDVGDRWAEVAERIAARGLDVDQPFLTLQYLYALVRARRAEAPALLAAIRSRAETAPAHAKAVWSEVATPAADGIAAHLAGRHPEASRELAAALPRMWQVGGSHAQRDLFEQIHLASVMAERRWGEAQQILERRRAHDPDGAVVNRQLARAYDALGLPTQAAAARERADATLARAA